MTQLNTIIQLRRDNDYNFQPIENKYIPANGEVILVDTSANGLRVKVGDGKSTFKQLEYIQSNFNDIIIIGFYNNQHFFEDNLQQNEISPQENKLYIDQIHSDIYYYNNNEFKLISKFPILASDIMPGIMKLYDTLGDNVDGTITQKSITNELNARYKTSVNTEEELLIFSL